MQRMVRFLMACCFVAGICLIFGQGAMAADKGPVAQVSEDTFDFGSISAGQDILHEFIIKNTGDAPLEIPSVKTS
ncbi:MAG: DUF1573 domain-containing protein [Deltaproteobacteria bacterium]|nr:DUF1573 domain-containing protein [Deltaproteobacteria bacterium]